ncbi:hypothetical protein M231_06617 [Tremella mesenterica]|uniref:Uncharacterized protein n=1 Tax=Tremella mesenterica TaxID=5217 RepID=A0A4Q1BDM5_TREME|nr:uncharacterized protein TREMEDRAFT_58592 [Tremella mesenterica DSM 1558]EIW72430.1 hypothetical protein TREMEDRAFT_58592 [Tremella mesenterica DSM 1558]RXK36126.1 hypothetical protein M231_06617 [Tremella mesenterica]
MSGTATTLSLSSAEESASHNISNSTEEQLEEVYVTRKIVCTTSVSRYDFDSFLFQAAWSCPETGETTDRALGFKDDMKTLRENLQAEKEYASDAVQSMLLRHGTTEDTLTALPRTDFELAIESNFFLFFPQGDPGLPSSYTRDDMELLKYAASQKKNEEYTTTKYYDRLVTIGQDVTNYDPNDQVVEQNELNAEQAAQAQQFQED